jgi:hypothetical protein
LTALEEIKSGDLINPSKLEEMLKEMVDRGVQSFSVEGSLLDWKDEGYMKVLEVKKENEKFVSYLQVEVPENRLKEKEKIEGRIRDAFLRSGLCKHATLPRVMEKLGAYDDVIIAPDTNVILDCVITSILWDEIKKGFPYWELVAIPKIVMAEIENKANMKIGEGGHPRYGWPTYEGRIGRRALQEILDLDTNLTELRRGLSIMTIGRLPQIYDELRRSGENWRMDSEIRTQIRDFIKSIDFHKGVFFLTQDRVNAMMSRAEGIEGLYLQKPDLEEVKETEMSLRHFSRLLYELTLPFGEIRVSGMGEFRPSFNLSIFWFGKHVVDWEESRVKITNLKTAKHPSLD